MFCWFLICSSTETLFLWWKWTFVNFLNKKKTSYRVKWVTRCFSEWKWLSVLLSKQRAANFLGTSFVGLDYFDACHPDLREFLMAIPHQLSSFCDSKKRALDYSVWTWNKRVASSMWISSSSHHINVNGDHHQQGDLLQALMIFNT